MTKFMINNRTDAWKTDVNLLTVKQMRVRVTHARITNDGPVLDPLHSGQG